MRLLDDINHRLRILPITKPFGASADTQVSFEIVREATKNLDEMNIYRRFLGTPRHLSEFISELVSRAVVAFSEKRPINFVDLDDFRTVRFLVAPFALL